MNRALADLAEADRGRLAAAPAPAHATPMKAVLTDRRFSDPSWIFERKLDGIRCIAIRDGSNVRLLSRNDLPLDDRYPEIAEALAGNRCERFAVDGEVVAFDGSQTSFSLLAQRKQRLVPVFLYLFDILWIDGFDVRRVPLRSRKRLLRRLRRLRRPGPADPLPERARRGAVRRGMQEGLGGPDRQAGVVHLHGAPLAGLAEVQVRPGPGARDRAATPTHRALAAASARCCSATTRATSCAMRAASGPASTTRPSNRSAERLDALSVPASPFADPGSVDVKAPHWVEPALVAQIGFTEWTRHGRLRHPRFLGLRDDKSASEVVREQ